MYKVANVTGNVQKSIQMYRDRQGGQSTRLQTDLLNVIKPRSNLEVRRQFFTVRIADYWNAVPSEVKNVQNVSQFKRKIVSWMEDKLND